ncbi:class I SAM-dependent methyltransferase [Algoriphagus sanaruensis]|uniref:Methyltransferase n=1 Tax=Algoriphagus sanaruensis TaxID=1727163 RepID=A0A142EQS4_9BACT|nr:class I SAM-dependent methyltransferase [Algoriphagus sanaruensis]AMQ57479.1 hypothetical protein AO498_13605 [Algoriphagus sanaruensis]
MNWVRKSVLNYLNSNCSNEGLSFDLKDPSNEDLLVLDSAPGGWSIDKKVAEAILQITRSRKVFKVVEVGAGYSTIVFHYSLGKINPNYEVVSIEENKDWFKVPKAVTNLIDPHKLNFKLGKLRFVFSRFGIHAKYKLASKNFTGKGVHMVFIDGPQYYYGREGGLDHIYSFLSVGCLIIMDDAERYTEKCVIFKWLKVYKGLELIYLNDSFGNKGLAVLKVIQPLKRRFSIAAFSLGMLQGIKRMANFRQIKEKQNLLNN